VGEGRRNVQSVIDPADKITIGNVADKEKKAVSGLVEATVAQSMSRQRAGIDVVGFRAGETDLLIPATIKVPIGLKQRAGRGGIETRRDI